MDYKLMDSIIVFFSALMFVAILITWFRICDWIAEEISITLSLILALGVPIGLLFALITHYS